MDLAYSSWATLMHQMKSAAKRMTYRLISGWKDKAGMHFGFFN